MAIIKGFESAAENCVAYAEERRARPTVVNQAIYDGALAILTATQALQELRRTDQTLADKRKLIDAERALHQARRILLSVYPEEGK